MAETPAKALKAALEAIRERVDYALKQLQDAEEQQRSMRWRCKECRYMKHFTRPVPLESAGKCPRYPEYRFILCNTVSDFADEVSRIIKRIRFRAVEVLIDEVIRPDSIGLHFENCGQ